MVRLIREQTFPDGTPTRRYGFVHALYQNALYAGLQPTRKAAWSAAAAHALLDHYGEKCTGLAAELAMLYEAARSPEPAATHYLTAAQNAIRVFAQHEAVALARHRLAQLKPQPDNTIYYPIRQEVTRDNLEQTLAAMKDKPDSYFLAEWFSEEQLDAFFA